MVTMAEERKTHNEYQFDAKAIVIPMVFGSGHGKASINRIHYQEGKFAVGTILCAVIPKDHDVLELLFLYYYCDVFKEELFVPLMRGMANVTLPLKALEELEIPLPPIDFQRKWVAKFEHISAKQTELRSELTHPQTLLTRLRQSILQEAVQGQLTAKWRQATPHQEPASELLRRIQAEKAATGKKEKPLPPVKAEEMPFELPEGWLWCNMMEVSSQITDGEHLTPQKTASGKMLLSAKNVRDGFIDYNNVDFCSEADYIKSIKRCNPEKGDVMIVSVGATIGRSSIVDGEHEFVIVRSVALIKPLIVSGNFLRECSEMCVKSIRLRNNYPVSKVLPAAFSTFQWPGAKSLPSHKRKRWFIVSTKGARRLEPQICLSPTDISMATCLLFQSYNSPSTKRRQQSFRNLIP